MMVHHRWRSDVHEIHFKNEERNGRPMSDGRNNGAEAGEE
jgi:hypothetical protein